MSARVPLDVDLEDKLIYGLTPTRLVYVVIALLGAFSTWSSQWAPSPVRAACAIAIVLIGTAAAWGRWRARAADLWLIDIAGFVLATHRLRWRAPRVISRLMHIRS